MNATQVFAYCIGKKFVLKPKTCNKVYHMTFFLFKENRHLVHFFFAYTISSPTYKKLKKLDYNYFVIY